jgi:GNAT superfamily N-acetyltransferase
MQEFRPRAIGPGDVPLLIGLAEAFHAEDGHALDAGGRRALEALATGEPLARGWLLEWNGRAVGYAVLTLGYSIEDGGRDGLLDDLYLAPEARGRGLGRQVMIFLEGEARRLGIRALHLEVGRENVRANRLYEAAGFRDSGRVLMSKRLA